MLFMPDEKASSLLAVTRQQVSGATGIARLFHLRTQPDDFACDHGISVSSMMQGAGDSTAGSIPRRMMRCSLRKSGQYHQTSVNSAFGIGWQRVQQW